MDEVEISYPVLGFALLTTILLQINSNLANDYGDFTHGTDNDDRVGPMRAMQSGRIAAAEMRTAIAITSVLSFLSGVVLLYLAPLSLWLKGLFLLLGILAIYASIKYTAGKNPYGYRGLGDVSVMAFFGLLGVIGSYACQTGAIEIDVFLPAIALGAFSTGVLNINNTRDLEADKLAGKITLAVRMGAEKARRYHVFLIALGMASFLLYALLHFQFGFAYLFLLSYPLLTLNAIKVWKTKEAKRLDPMLKQLALSTFLLSILLGVGLVLQG